MPLLACQRDSRLRQLHTQVLWCRPQGDLHLAAVEDSPLYPEGGGQPADRGQLNGVPVLDVQTLEGQVVLSLAAPVAPGPAELLLDWERRFDHMQQHSGQHLISALALGRLGRGTVGFHLGEVHTLIDLNGAPLSEDERAQLERWANEEILAARPVTPRVVRPDELEALNVRTRGFKATDEVRLIDIQGLDLNTCGGTHVSNTLELQAIAIPIAERYKGGTRLTVKVGGRVLKALNQALALQARLTALMQCAPEEHPSRVEGLLAERQAEGKQRQALMKELAGHLAQSLLQQSGPVASLHHPSADLGALKGIAQAFQAAAPQRLALLTGGEPPRLSVVIVGPAELVKARGPAALAALGGRGGGAGGLMQGVAAGLEGLEAALGALNP